ncbi:MAG: YceI family protein [Elusimicrobia bacterium]|nr:YceI family protein [Elusimicrobiota bacterium]
MNRKVLLALFAVALAVPAAAETYSIDAYHGTVGFRIRHLVGKVSGRFDTFSGSFDFVPGKPEQWKAMASIDAASINTGNPKRDEHLRTEDFFDVTKCPKIEFVSKNASVDKDGLGTLSGDLTMHCVTKPVTLALEIGETLTDMQGKKRLGVSARGKLDRKQFGINYNKALDQGGFVLGDDVHLELDIEGILADSAAPAAQKAKQETKKGK